MPEVSLNAPRCGSEMRPDVLIVGGGLSGLALADALEAAGIPYLLVEARDRLGGRILTEQAAGAHLDLGPAWFWPGQPRVSALVDRFGLTRFAQHHEGILTVEDAQGLVQRGRGFASMEGAWRIAGGVGALVDALAAGLPGARLRLGSGVSRLSRVADRIEATLADGTLVSATSVVLAAPPRVIAERIRFEPPLPPASRAALSDIPTWMAGQAKAVAVYDTPFWRDAALSGDAMSQAGPMVEIHDASPAMAEVGALFGFLGVPPGARGDEDALRTAVCAQLGRLFGPQAAAPRALFIKDWAHDPLTATARDQGPLLAHPRYGLPPEIATLWDRRLLFAGTEVAPQFGGFLEGALEAAESAFHTLTNTEAHDRETRHKDSPARFG